MVASQPKVLLLSFFPRLQGTVVAVTAHDGLAAAYISPSSAH